MKVLKYLAFIIVAVVLAFLAVGLVKPSVEYGHEIEVNKPVEEAWAVARDESKFGQWLAGFQSIELLSGEQDEAGSTYKVVVNPGEGQPEFVMTQTLVEIEEFDHVTMHFDSEMMDFEQTIWYGENDGKATVRTESNVMAKGMTMRSMFALMEVLGGSFTSQETENIEALKTVIEENTTNYYPEEVEPEAEMMDTETASNTEESFQ